MDEFAENGYTFFYAPFYRTIKSFIDDNCFEDANVLLDDLIQKDDHRTYAPLAMLLVFAGRSEDALDIIRKKRLYYGDVTPYDLLVVAKAKLRLGYINDAKNRLKYASKIATFQNQKDMLPHIEKLLTMIDNYYNKKAFIEIEYSAFTKRGYKLEPGHVVRLNNSPEILAGEGNSDPFFNTRNFFIWKIEDNTIWLIPLCIFNRECYISEVDQNGFPKKKKGYIIYKEDYPNVGRDRSVKDSFCKTTTDNVQIVVDKLNEKDYKNCLYNAYLSTYFKKHMNEYMLSFLHERCREVRVFDLIEYIDIYTKERTNIFVTDITDDNYIGYKVDHSVENIADFKPYEISRKLPIFDVHYINDGMQQALLHQLDYKPLIKKRSDN